MFFRGKQFRDGSVGPEKLAPAFVADLLRASSAVSWLVDQNAGGMKLTDLGAPAAPADAARLQEVQDAIAAIPPVPVSSVFGRIGNIVALLGDYAASQVGNDSFVPGLTVADALNALLANPPTVSSVFGRIGAIVAAAGDYAASQVNNDSSVSGVHVKDALNALQAAIAASVTGVSSVFGRTGTVVATAGDYAASLVNNDSSVSGVHVKDALNTLGSALAALVTGVSSVYGRTGAVVAQSGDYTAAQVGLGNVTNDAQLKRAANDFTTFSQKTAPTSSDVVLIEDQAASGVKKYATLSALGAGFPTPSSGNPFIDPPASANPWDDEFNSGSPDFLVRGWTIKDGSGNVMTRSGDINPWDINGPSGNTYWSTLIGSWIFYQCAPGKALWIMKPVSLANGETYFCRVGTSFRFDSSGATSKFQEFGFYQNLSGLPDTSQRAYTTRFESGGGAQLGFFRQGNGVGASAGNGRDGWGSFDIRGARVTNPTVQSFNYAVFATDSANGETVCEPLPTPTIPVANVAWVALSFNGPAAGQGAFYPAVAQIDFFRKKTGGAWIVP